MNKGLLEKFSGAAAAYSVRLLNRQYTGALMKIRRVDSVTSQDNGEIFVFPDNTGWVSLNSKVVDPSHASEATTLGGFVNASGYTDGDKTTIGTNTQNAYVVVWKDQSGNSNDASQGTTTSQPQIISAGALIVENGKPAVDFNGSNHRMSTTGSISWTDGEWYVNVVGVRDVGASSGKLWNADQSGGDRVAQFANINSTSGNTISFQVGGGNTQDNGGSTSEGKQFLLTSQLQSSNLEIFIDGSGNGATSVSSQVTSSRNSHIGWDGSGGYLDGKVQEIVHYPSSQLNRTNIEDDINTAFNIYNNAPTPKKNSFLGKYPGAAAAYSTRNLTGKANQPLLKVRRELGTDTDTEETIYSSNNQLDTNQLLNFVNGVGEDPRPPLDISEGYGYSLRIVKSGYQGPLIEVRESSGNTTKDFYADSTGRINEQALLDFCGANDGHVSKWYNQSGVDRHLTSDAAANEPKIVESGVVVKDTLGNVALKFTNAGNEFLAIQDAAVFDLQEQTIAMHFMSTALPASGSKRIIGVPQTSGETFDASIRNNVSISATGAIALTSQSTSVTLNNISQTVNSPSILTINFKGSDTSGTSNKTTQSTTLPTTSVKGLSVGARFTVTATPDFLTSEVIQYTSAQIGDNKNEVEASLNKQYKIYGDAYVSTWYDQSTAASDNLLLDDNPDAAAAYSLRKLRELYQGSAINVRRGSDNATKDIGFTSSGELDINELINFCSGTDGFVTTWYNQAFTSKNELLLDTVEGSGAAAAYSVRQLSSTATECMVIRRSSDGKTRTIGFRDTHIDEAAIESFCSGTTCTVQTWKDQSGNSNDATQATPANQPTIYTGGAIVKDNGRVALQTNGTESLVVSSSFNQPLSTFTTASADTSSVSLYDAFWGDTSAANRGIQYRAGGQVGMYFGTVLQSNYVMQDTQELYSAIINGATSSIDVSGTNIVSGNAGSGGLSNLMLFGYYTSLIEGKGSEFLFFDSAKSSSDQDSIESNINNYYGIFSTNNAEQDVALNQPKIYDSSTGVVTEGTKPAINLDSTDFFDLGSLSAASGDNVSYYWVGDWTGETSNNNRWILHADDTGNYLAPISTNGVTTDGYAGLSSVTGYKDGVSVAVATRDNVHDTFTNVYHLGELYGTTTTAFSSTELGRYPVGNNFYLNGNLQEFILYTSDQSSRRLNIEGNINNHYRIYSLNDATQATALSQPKLVSSGRVILENGKPAVDFDGSNDKLVLSSINITNEYVSTMSVHTRSVLSTSQEVCAVSNGAAGKRRGFWYSPTNILYASGFNSNLPLRNNAPLEKVLATAFFDNANNQISGSYNGSYVSAGSYTLSDMSSPHLSIGEANDGFSAFFNGSIQEYLVYALDKSTDRIGIESNINGAFDIYWDGSKRGLLDDQPNAAAAYSVRALSSSYTGPLIEIRDGSGNTRDIYATYNGDLDETAIETFCSGTTCTVSKWYDQSGNANDASQADALSQPTIYTGGALVKDGGRLALDFDGTDDELTSTTVPFSGTTHRTSFTISNADTATSADIIYGIDGGTASAPSGELWQLTSESAVRVSGKIEFVSSAQTSQSLATVIFDGTTVDDINLYLNGSLKTQTGSTGTTINTGSTNFGIGTTPVTTNNYDGKQQELIFYASDKSTERTNIERNINQYFNIYTDPGVDRLLNKYPGAAAAYSLRKLNSQYTGPAVRVRRDSDNVHADVYFDRTATISKYSRVGVLSSSTDPIAAASTTTLQTFMGSNNGFVAVWYDQASSNDASQSSATAQPKIYDSADGVIVKNGKPAFEFTGGTGQRLDIGSYGSTAPWTILQVMGRTSSAASSEYIGTLRSNDNYFYNLSVSGSTIRLESRANGQINSSYVTETTNLLAYHKIDGSSSEIALNGAAVATGTQNPNLSAVVIGKGGAVMTTGDAFFQEYIVYQSDQSSNRTKIESDINNHYSIYAKPKKLLDQYGGAAAAYSLRSLHSNYTGPLVTIRRDSDGIEVDVYADINGEFSLNSIVKNVTETTTGATQGTFNPGTPLVTLSQFVQGSPNCYVVEWKDQSGNGNHAAQVTAANQPKIYDSVTGVVTENGKTAMDFDGSDDFFESSAFSISDGSVAAAFVFTGGLGTYLHSQNGTVRGAYGTGDHFFIHLGTTPTTTRTNLSGPSGQALIGWRVNDGTTDLYENGTSVASETYTGSVTTGTTGLDIMQRNNNGSRINGRMQEIIYYGTNKGSDMPNIQSAINDYYQIY